jgi:hypothetical protein
MTSKATPIQASTSKQIVLQMRQDPDATKKAQFRSKLRYFKRSRTHFRKDKQRCHWDLDGPGCRNEGWVRRCKNIAITNSNDNCPLCRMHVIKTYNAQIKN